jgi:lipid-binding SYLF domain-containing protein
MTKFTSILLAAIVSLFALAGCSTAPSSHEDRAELRRSSHQAADQAQVNDPTLVPVMRNAAGYAVFPSVAKGAVGVGGAYGKGELYEGGVVIGFCDLSQATIGVQLGGQAYTEVIVFQSQQAVDTFKQGNFRFDAQATAVALRSGAGANAKYTNGVAVFTMDEKGLMYEASVGGQKFSYQPR